MTNTYNENLKSAINFLQSTDSNGFYLELWEEFTTKEISLYSFVSEVLDILKENIEIAQDENDFEWEEKSQFYYELVATNHKGFTLYEVYDNFYINKESAQYIIDNYGNPSEEINYSIWDGKQEVYMIVGDEQILVDLSSATSIDNR